VSICAGAVLGAILLAAKFGSWVGRHIVEVFEWSAPKCCVALRNHIASNYLPCF